jgi:energy-coupling factor transport system ATP-binding protein
VLDLAGTVVDDGAPAEIIERQRDFLLSNGVWVPGEPPPAPMEVPAALMRPWHVVGQPELVNAERVGLLLRNRLLRQRSAAVALRDVDCVIEGGCGLAITGPSGAGKSSLVRVLAGLQRPTAGRVVAALPLSARGSREPHRWRSRELAARFAWVPQFPEQGVVTHTVADEVMATNRACGRDDAEGAERAQQLLELLGLQSLRSASPYHLSGGEQRRLMVAAALASGPCVVLSDEPTVGQDRSTWAAVMGAFAAARTAGAGVAIASHDVNAVAALGDEHIVLRHGSRVP